MEGSRSSDSGGRGRGSGGLGASTCSVRPVPRVVEGHPVGCSTSLPRRALGTFKRPPRSGKGCSYRGCTGSYWSSRLGWCRSIPLPCPRDALERSQRPKALAAAMLPWRDGLFSAWVAFRADLPLLTPPRPGEGILWCFWLGFFWLGVDTVLLLPKPNKPWICKQKLR